MFVFLVSVTYFSLSLSVPFSLCSLSLSLSLYLSIYLFLCCCTGGLVYKWEELFRLFDDFLKQFAAARRDVTRVRAARDKEAARATREQAEVWWRSAHAEWMGSDRVGCFLRNSVFLAFSRVFVCVSVCLCACVCISV